MTFRLEDLVVKRGSAEPIMRVIKVETLTTGRQRLTVEFPDEDPASDFLFQRRYLAHRLEAAPEGAHYMPECSTGWIDDIQAGCAPVSRHFSGYERALIRRDRDRLARSRFTVIEGGRI